MASKATPRGTPALPANVVPFPLQRRMAARSAKASMSASRATAEASLAFLEASLQVGQLRDAAIACGWKLSGNSYDAAIQMAAMLVGWAADMSRARPDLVNPMGDRPPSRPGDRT